MMWILAAAVPAAGGAGYVVGRFRTGRRLADWADEQYGRSHWRVQWILAQPVLAFQIAYCLAVHPVRSYRHLRWYGKSAGLQPVLVPVRDPNWATTRADRGEHR